MFSFFNKNKDNYSQSGQDQFAYNISGDLVSYEDNQLSQDKLVFFTGIEKAKFKRPVTPGCVLKLKINLLTNKRSLYKFSGEAYVDNNLVASSDFSAMLVDQDKAK